MSFNIDDRPEYTAWVAWKHDKEEKYLIRYLYEDEYKKILQKNDVKLFECVIDNIIDWSGIIDKNGKKVECSQENKELVFTKFGPGSRERLEWIWIKMIIPTTFIDVDDQLKNLKRESK